LLIDTDFDSHTSSVLSKRNEIAQAVVADMVEPFINDAKFAA
jgi:hypothetical protein